MPAVTSAGVRRAVSSFLFKPPSSRIARNGTVSFCTSLGGQPRRWATIP
jgi:hypothetical protein